MHPVINIECLRKYRPSPRTFGERMTLPPLQDDLKIMDEYEVEAILGHCYTSKKLRGRRQYLIRWKGYGPEDDTWESAGALRNAPDLKREYDRVQNL